MSLQVHPFSGQAALPFIDELARLRIQVFREFPYLYEGDYEYERNYLQTFLGAPGNLLALAFDGSRVVGASTAMPMIHETPNIQAPFQEKGFDLERIYYFSESILEKAYRGRGIGKEFFRLREEKAVELGGFGLLAFCAVLRPADHPLRPPDYAPLDAFWQKQGFSRHDELVCSIPWKDLTEPAESPKSLVFWLKEIRPH